MILFRADGSPQVGSGHIMRCLSLADAFRDMGQTVIFVTADECFQAVIQSRGYEGIVLQTRYDDMQGELPVLIPLLRKLRPCCVLLDSYFVTSDYMLAIKQEVQLVYIDDQNAFDYPADLVVNYMLYADKFAYPQNKRYLLGPKYALLRKEFRNVPWRQAKGRAADVLLSTGGADSEHMALRCVKHLRKRPDDGITYHVVLGAMNQDTTEIERLSAGCTHIVLHRNVSDMRSLMLQCDAAVSAGGTTLFELCACGIPAVTYILADNQILNAESFKTAGLMLCAGDIRGNGQAAEAVFKQLERLIQDQASRQHMAEQMRLLVDGNGASRLAKKIREFCGS